MEYNVLQVWREDVKHFLIIFLLLAVKCVLIKNWNKDPLQNQGASVGRLFIIPGSQPQEAGARVGGTAAQILADNTYVL